MKTQLLIILYCVVFSTTLVAENGVGVQVSNEGLIEKIIPFYTKPTLRLEEESNDIEDTIFVSNEESLSIRDGNFLKEETDYRMEVSRLMSLPEMSIPIKNTPLNAAIRMCAEASGMNYIAPTELEFSEPITLKIRSNPFVLLKLMEERYDLGMKYEFGMWHFFKMNWNELITKSYKLKFNNLVVVKSTPPTLSMGVGSSGGGSYGGNAGNGSDVFDIMPEKIVNELKHELLLAPTTGGNVVQAISDEHDIPSINARNQGLEAPQPKIIYNDDSNELLVVATRQQHSYVEKYLETIDKPQRLIRIAAKFVETTRDPQSELGIDWTGVGKAKFSVTGLPNSALLSMSDMSAQLNFLSTDSKSKIVQDPQVVTVNNKNVSLKSVTLEPIESSSFDNTSGNANNVISTKLEYLEIGTIIDVYPQIMEGGIAGFDGESVKLSVSIVVSSIISEKVINGKTAPSIASRTYDYTVVVPNGHTLVIGGLTEYADTKSEVGIVGLSRVPLVGNLFKSKKKRKLRRNLVDYITPEIINGMMEKMAKKVNIMLKIAENGQL